MDQSGESSVKKNTSTTTATATGGGGGAGSNNNNVVKLLTAEQTQQYRQNEERVDALIAKLIDQNNMTKTKLAKETLLCFSEIEFLIEESKNVIESQSLILSLLAPVKIFGDLHGQYCDLLRWLNLISGIENTLFLGDYVDRGKNSIETICLLLAFKIKYPLTVFLLRGNHETHTINKIYGFFDELQRRYGSKGHTLYKQFTNLFNYMPIAAVVEDKIFCCHGGIPKDIMDFYNQAESICRPFDPCVDPPNDESFFIDLLWADPQMESPGFQLNSRGVSYTFGRDVFHKFMIRYGFDLMVRAHQVCEDGYDFFERCEVKGENNRVHRISGVTIFSAPDYCGEFDNSAAIVVVDKDLLCSFMVLSGSSSKSVGKLHYRMPSASQLSELEKRVENSTSQQPTSTNSNGHGNQ